MQGMKRRGKRRRSVRGQENRQRYREEAETKHPIATRRRSSAAPARGTLRGRGTPVRQQRGQEAGGRGRAAPVHRPRPHLRGPGPQRGRRRRQRAPRSAGLGGPGAHGRWAAEVGAAPRTAGAKPGQPSGESARAAAGSSHSFCCCAALGTADRPLRPPQGRARPDRTNRRRGRPGAAPREVVTNARDLAPGPARAQVRNKPGQQKPGAQRRGEGEREGGRERRGCRGSGSEETATGERWGWGRTGL